jgi:hypothetical protein
MTTDIRETLHDIGSAVAPPLLDRAAFEGRVRRVRRHRRLARAAVATAALATVGVAAWLVAPGGPGTEPDLATDPDHVTTGGTSVLVFAEHGRITTTSPYRPMLEIDSGVPVEEVLGPVNDGVLFKEPDGRMTWRQVHPDGAVDMSGLAYGTTEPVSWAGVDPSRTTLWYVDLRNGLHRMDLATGQQTKVGQLDGQAMVLAVGTDRWVEQVGDVLTLHTGDASYDVRPAFRALDAYLAGDVLAVVTDDGTEVFSAADGKRLVGSLGGSEAALSPDGRWVASGANDADHDLGMSYGLWLFEAGADQVRDVGFGDDTGPITDIWWADDERFLAVVETSADGQLIHTLYECTVDGGCQTRIEDESGTLELPRD